MTDVEDLVAAIDGRLCEIGDTALDKAALCVLDVLACALGGADLPWSRAAARVAPTSSSGSATTWADGRRSTELDAAWVNAVHAHAIVQEDMHPSSVAHFGPVVVPGVLALGERLGSTGREVLEAVVAGYEVGGRIGKALLTHHFLDRGFRPSTVFGPLAAAAGAARLLRLDQQRTVAAIGLAASSGGGTTHFAYAGTQECYFQLGAGARTGVLSALLAEQGVEGSSDAVQGPHGLVHAFGGGDPAVLEPNHPPDWEIEQVFHKSAPSCAFTQEAVAAARRLRSLGPAHTSLANVTIHTYQLGKTYPGCDNPTEFGSIIARQMSAQHAVATVLVHGDLEVDHYLAPVTPEVRSLAQRIRIETDPSLESAVRGALAVRLEARTTSGDRVEVDATENQPLTAEQVSAKFQRLAAPALGSAAASDMSRAVLRLRAAESVSAVLEPLRAERAQR